MTYARTLIALLLLTMAGVAGAQGLMVSRYVAGEHYKVADQPVPQPDDGKIHVVEFFLYSCPHCYHLEPKLEAWRKQLPDDVEFSRVPVLFGGAGQAYARLYHTAVALGVIDAVHADIFDAIHRQGRSLTSEAAMRAFMIAHGVDGARFEKVYESQAITDELRADARWMRALQVTATPSLGVAGRYWISGRTAGSNQAMLDVADYLIKQARD